MVTNLETLGLLTAFVGFWVQSEGRSRASRMMWFRREALWTTGTVVRTDRIVRRGKTRFATVFEYTAEDGRAYTVVSKELTATPEFEPGALVTVGYQPDHPDEAILNNAVGAPDLHPWAWFGWGLVVSFVGLAIIVLGLRLKA